METEKQEILGIGYMRTKSLENRNLQLDVFMLFELRVDKIWFACA